MKKGYVTVFFSIAISLILSLVLVMIYGIRENAMRLRIREAADISIRSTFGEYAKELWDRYQLVFVDAGYGYESSSMILAEQHYINTMNRNFDEKGIVMSAGTDLLKLTCDGADAIKVRYATDYKGEAVISQAIRVMKYKYGIAYFENLNYENQLLTILELEKEDISKDFDDVLAGPEIKEAPILEEWVCAAKEGIYEKKDVALLSTLRLLFSDVSSISSNTLNKQILLENRKINEGNYQSKKYELTDILIFDEYILNHCGSYTSQGTDTALCYEVEYLLSGREEDSENLETVVNRLLLIREASNIKTLISDSERMNEIKAICEVAAMLLMNPELASALESVIVCVWAFAESMCDVLTLLNGGMVPLLKDSTQWRSSLADVLTKSYSTESYEEGETYKDYLRLFLLLENNEKVRCRLLNLIEANVRLDRNDSNFRLDNCFDAWRIAAIVNSEHGIGYEVEREYDIEE